MVKEYKGHPITNTLQYIYKTKEIVVVSQNFRTPINIFILLHALGIETEQEQLSMIVWDTGSKSINTILELILPALKKYKTIIASHKLKTVTDIHRYLLRYRLRY